MTYDPRQPRAPSGTEIGGQWVKTSFTVRSVKEPSARYLVADAMELEGLVYDKERKAWIRRDGKEVQPETAQRLKAAGVSAGYLAVSLNPDPFGALQAKCLDAAGRVQPKYSKEHSEAAAAEKFVRLVDFNHDVPAGRSRIAEAMKKGETERIRDAAAIVRLVEHTGIRIGSDRETGAKVRAFGASTLMGEHIGLMKDGTITLNFTGKHGKLNEREFKDPVLYAYLSKKDLKMGQRVFNASDSDANGMIKKMVGKDYSAKDYRTRYATALALQHIKTLPIPKTAKEFAAQRLAVGKFVSAHISNTPQMALGSYIDPAVFQPWGKP